MSGMQQIGDQCRNRWRSILPMMGIAPQFLTGKHGPCPVCDGKDRFRFDDKDGKGTFFCNNCGAGDGLKLLMLKTGRTFLEMTQAIRAHLGETQEAPGTPAADLGAARRRAGALWQTGVPIFGDEAEQYLIGRGIRAPYSPALRFCRSAPVTGHPSKRNLPAMLALVMDADGRPCNVHRTYLENGQKAHMPSPRKMMSGTVPEGSAIRLFEHSGVLGVAEGIETALRVESRFKIPCWSLIDAEKLRRFVVPEGLRELHIFGDNDLNFVGQSAAYDLGRRAKGMKDGPEIVLVNIPIASGTDWADPS